MDLQPDPSCCPPAALARDQLVFGAVVGHRTDQHRLQHPHFPNRVGERAQRFFVEVVPGLEPVGPDRGGRDLLEAHEVPGALAAVGGDERPEPLTQSAAIAPPLTSFASSRYAVAPRDVESNTMIGCPNDGASESLTVLGTTVL